MYCFARHLHTLLLPSTFPRYYTRAKSSLLGEETKGEHIRVICGYFNIRGMAKYRELRVKKHFSNAIRRNSSPLVLRLERENNNKGSVFYLFNIHANVYYAFFGCCTIIENNFSLHTCTYIYLLL